MGEPGSAEAAPAFVPHAVARAAGLATCGWGDTLLQPTFTVRKFSSSFVPVRVSSHLMPKGRL